MKPAVHFVDNYLLQPTNPIFNHLLNAHAVCKNVFCSIHTLKGFDNRCCF